jgi:hypothetical protein
MAMDFQHLAHLNSEASQQIGGSLGAALLNTIAISSAAAFAKGHTSLGSQTAVFAQVHGFTTTFKWGAVFIFLKFR